ncbi:GGDEF domain-containing protein [Thiomicrorhabdus sp. ZW0627]|uniref:GGDEF domain-containing protein n=1 Tax=Thiomicrorhabdus sp. ZW0627 TaxID=3039774 RepID=UPI002436689B|nr:GGDEF domain-containing protein [Thiomicrorhabdus sp. ZW0627]MDG6773686.1 GGDEF domain-containing protein [Thiomicrorhabdus sp. ZW0627]
MNRTPTSVLQRYQADKNRSEALSKQSLEKIDELKLSSNPIHFTLIYEWLSQADPYYSEEMDRIIRQGNYDDKTAENMFIGLITQLLYKTLPTEKACTLLNELLSKLNRWVAENNKKQETLNNEISTLSDFDLPEEASVALNDRILPLLKSLNNDASELERQVIKSSEEIRLLKEELERTSIIAKTDELTNIPNRRGFNEIIHKISLEAQEAQSSFAIILLDLDHFKNVNDTFGHLIGDSVLRYVAKLLHNETKGQDSIARFGGEEFVVLLPGTTYDSAIQVANNIRKKIAARPLQIKANYQTLKLTVSSGVAMYQMGEDLEKLFHRVDQCLYLAKSKGRNVVCGESEL